MVIQEVSRTILMEMLLHLNDFLPVSTGGSISAKLVL